MCRRARQASAPIALGHGRSFFGSALRRHNSAGRAKAYASRLDPACASVGSLSLGAGREALRARVRVLVAGVQRNRGGTASRARAVPSVSDCGPMTGTSNSSGAGTQTAEAGRSAPKRNSRRVARPYRLYVPIVVGVGLILFGIALLLALWF